MNFYDTYVDKSCHRYVKKVLDTRWLNTGTKVEAFEQALAGMGVPNPVLVNSATSGLLIALAMAGVRPGSEVVIPPMGFIATGMAVKILGATPVFADVERDTGNISAADLQARIRDCTRAVIAVHWAGNPCDMQAVLGAAQSCGVIADAAQAFGAEYHGRPVWDCAWLSVFSLHAIKQVACGDGGLIACFAPGDAREARMRSEFGLDWTQPRGPLGERECDSVMLGFKARMNDLSAAVGLGNLNGFWDRLKRRRRIADTYREALENVPGLRLPRVQGNRRSACHGFMVLVEDRDGFAGKMHANSIPVGVLHRRIDRFSILGGRRDDLPNTDWYDERHISLPFHETVTDKDIEHVVATIRSGW